MQGKSGCFAVQKSRFWKTEEKALIFCKDISWLRKGEMEYVNSYFGVANTATQGGEADAQKK
ncbi:hypothetical protein PIOMA14_II_0409 [Prevotella intermedia]|uniref:Uncharacterized protein n=1 Tax=Prevotella intermedia TaxID=28131 RepID=A0A0T7APB4_PREIN|nr:hypothetical protein PIOMA14_II_0409 [Prevotella intermedia]